MLCREEEQRVVIIIIAIQNGGMKAQTCLPLSLIAFCATARGTVRSWQDKGTSEGGLVFTRVISQREDANSCILTYLYEVKKEKKAACSTPSEKWLKLGCRSNVD